ncbi:MAG: DUF370 domain-containing protein [Ardenticatenales bacterium]|nr:DUF370 domain-containing protein [Ardenticatenales bacterium]
MLASDEQGLLFVERLIAVGPADSAAMRRFLSALPLSQIVSLTGGQKRRTILIMDTGHAIITALSLEALERKLWEQQNALIEQRHDAPDHFR